MSAWGLATGQSSYLTADLLGSVRLVSTQGQQVIGAGAYDAWGDARPNTTDVNGQVLLAGLQGSQPFGYAGQYLDPGSGTYDRRAREYSPQQGQFLSEDPQAPTDTIPVTIDPYEYAGDMPTDVTDMSGKGWRLTYPSSDYYQVSRIAGPLFQCGINSDTPACPLGDVQAAVGSAGPSVWGTWPSDQNATHFWVQVMDKDGKCGYSPSQNTLVGCTYSATHADIVGRATHMVWDVEHADAYTGGLAGQVNTRVVDVANSRGYWLQEESCQYSCTPTVLRQGSNRQHDELNLGTGYPQVFGLSAALINTALLGVPGAPYRVNYKAGRIVRSSQNQDFIVAWEQDPGVILYKELKPSELKQFYLSELHVDPSAHTEGLGFRLLSGALYAITTGGSTFVGTVSQSDVSGEQAEGYVRTVLVVGESDTFEYSQALAKAHSDWFVVGTKYSGSGVSFDSRLSKLKLISGVDATNLGDHFKPDTFTDVVFNAPRAVADGKDSFQKGPAGDLVDDVLMSARCGNAGRCSTIQQQRRYARHT